MKEMHTAVEADEDDMPVVATFICLGLNPEPGCGKILTDEEREQHDDCCNACMATWEARYNRWENGAVDKELDDIFDACEGSA